MKMHKDERTHKAVQLLGYLKGREEKDQLAILDLCISMSYDKGACSVIKLIAQKGLVSKVDAMNALNELGEDINKDINKQIDQLVEINGDCKC